MGFEDYMQLALHQAKKAAALNEVPVGAIVTNSVGQVIGSGHNLVEEKFTQTAHAELIALTQAGLAIGDWRLAGCSIYVTLEPCAMCMSAIILSRISRVVFAAPSRVFGYRVDKQISFTIYNFPIEIHEGVLASEAEALLCDFFARCRRSAGE